MKSLTKDIWSKNDLNVEKIPLSLLWGSLVIVSFLFIAELLGLGLQINILLVFALTLAIIILVMSLINRLTVSRKELEKAKYETEKKVRQLQYFYAVSKETTKVRNLNSLIEIFLEQIISVLDIKKCALYLAEVDNFKLKRSLGFKYIDGQVISKEVIDQIDSTEVLRLDAEEGQLHEIIGFNGYSLFIPLKSKDHLIGFIIAQAEPEETFDEENISLVKALIPQITAALHNSVLFDRILIEEKKALQTADYLNKSRSAVLNILEDISILNKRLEKAIAQTKSMYRVAVDISRSIEQEKLLDLILKNAMKLVSAKGGVILLKTKGQLLPFKEININLRAENDTCPGSKAYDTGRTVIVNDLKENYKKFSEDYPDIKNVIAVPLVQNKRVLGSLCLFNKQRFFDEDDKKLLITLANQAIISLLNARIFEREKETVKKLKELDKIKDDFVAGISHELKTPLTSIKGYLELLLEGEVGQLSGQQEDFLNIINQSSDRLLNLIMDLLDFAKIESSTFELHKSKASLPLLLKRSIVLIKPQIAKKKLVLKTDITNMLPDLEVDNGRIEQVMLNLLTNAIKFSHDKGEIGIACHRENGSIITEVSDTGIGISDEDQKNLFTKFFRSSNAISRGTPGTGLGLAISKGIIEQHGGKIWIESKSGKGSTFYFSLPIKT